MSHKLTRDRTDGLLKKLFTARRHLQVHEIAEAQAALRGAIIQLSGAYRERKCPECGVTISVERYRRMDPRHVVYCSKRCQNRASKRRQYIALQNDPARYTSYLMRKRYRSAEERKRRLREHRCSTCGQPNDNDTRRVCERCLMKARRSCS